MHMGYGHLPAPGCRCAEAHLSADRKRRNASAAAHLAGIFADLAAAAAFLAPRAAAASCAGTAALRRGRLRLEEGPADCSSAASLRVPHVLGSPCALQST